LITTLIAFYLAIYLAKQRQQEIETHDSAVKAYLGTRAFIEQNSSTWSPGASAQAIKAQDDYWTTTYSWPIPKYPPEP